VSDWRNQVDGVKEEQFDTQTESICTSDAGL
jgi:hypothetical protein